MSQWTRVSASAALKRINRALSDAGRQIRHARGFHAMEDLGEYYEFDVRQNQNIDRDVDLDRVGRKLGVLHPWEYVKHDWATAEFGIETATANKQELQGTSKTRKR